MINKKSKIYIAGHNGLVGSAILRKFRSQKYSNLIYRTRKQLDLTSKNLFYEFIKHPLMSFKVIAAIHFEAFRLWTKGIKHVARKIKIKNNLSLEN